MKTIMYILRTHHSVFLVLHAEKQEGPGIDYLHMHNNYSESLVTIHITSICQKRIM